MTFTPRCYIAGPMTGYPDYNYPVGTVLLYNGSGKLRVKLGDDEWIGMLCVEAANGLDAPVTLRPGQTHHLKQRITLA